VALYVVAFLAAVLRRLPGALPAAAKAAGALPAPQQQRAPPPPPPPPLPPLPGWVSPALWGVFALYAYALLLGTELPGEPAWNIQPHTLQSVTDLSLDFFFVAPALDAAGLSLFPAPAVHPAELALFNLVNAWSLMFLGLLAADARGARLPLLPVWSGQMFLTNVFLLPWMAARASPGASADADDDAAADAAVSADARLPPPLAALAASPLLGVVGGAVGVASVAWFALADVPGAAAGADASSLAARWAHLLSVAQEDRLTLAFGVDCVVYSAAQARHAAWLACVCLHTSLPLRCSRHRPLFLRCRRGSLVMSARRCWRRARGWRCRPRGSASCRLPAWLHGSPPAREPTRSRSRARRREPHVHDKQCWLIRKHARVQRRCETAGSDALCKTHHRLQCCDAPVVGTRTASIL
jgi:hypothetical protein